MTGFFYVNGGSKFLGPIPLLPALHFFGHDLNDETDPNPQHPVKQLGLGLNEHGQVHQQFLKFEPSLNWVTILSFLRFQFIPVRALRRFHLPCGPRV